MKPYDQDTYDKARYVGKIAVFVGVAAAASLVLAIFASTVIGASSWSPRDGCEYKIQRGDTLSKISKRTGLTVSDHVAANPSITNPNLIIEGKVMDVCHPAVSSGKRPALVKKAPPHPGEIVRWARAVEASRPAWATDADVRFLVAVSGPESGHGTSLWNPHDVGGPFTGSYGVVQIRVLRNPANYPDEWFRDQAWLEQSFRRQARGAWVILGLQGQSAWGPHTDGKLPNNCNNSKNVSRCQTWWAQADRAIQAI